jgi:hypothetical protein
MDEYVAAEEGFKRGYEKGYADGKKHAEDEIIILKQKRANIFEILDAYERGRVNALKWIPVTERLPKKFNNALAVRKCGDWFSIDVECIIADGKWCGDVFDKNEVTHWMPLPEPPREE